MVGTAHAPLPTLQNLIFGSPVKPTGRREAPPDDRLRAIRDYSASRLNIPGLRYAPSGLRSCARNDDKPQGSLRAALPRGDRPAMTKSIIWSIDGPGLRAHCAIICGWKNRIIPVHAHIAASGTSATSNSPVAAPSAITEPMVWVIRSM